MSGRCSVFTGHRRLAMSRIRHWIRRGIGSGCGSVPALCALLTLMSLTSVPGAAQELPPQISPLTSLDQQYMDRQRDSVDELARLNLGTSCCSDVEELPVLQRLLDEGVIGPEQRQELQAMGIVLGDILAAELDMDWVIYEDQLGRSRALRLGDTDNYLFPATMISRRREAGNTESVEDIFNGAFAAIAPLKPPKPYQ